MNVQEVSIDGRHPMPGTDTMCPLFFFRMLSLFVRLLFNSQSLGLINVVGKAAREGVAYKVAFF